MYVNHFCITVDFFQTFDRGQTKYDNKTNLSEGFKSGDSYLTAVKSNESTDNAIGKRQDSYEEPDDRL